VKVPVPPTKSTFTVIDELTAKAVITPSRKLAVLAELETRTRSPTMYPPVVETTKFFDPVAMVALVDDDAPP
jgi:hypothetical protein